MINVVMTTYFPDDPVGNTRVECAKRVVESMLKGIVCDEPICLLIADDGSPETRAVAIHEMIRQADDYWETMSKFTNAHRGGIGRSLNAALQKVDNDSLWMYNTDDWRLDDTLDLTGPIKLLRYRNYDLVRLGPIHPDLRCMTRFDSSIGWWLDIDQQYGGFAFATRPFIATKAFYTKVGPFDERLNSYETERLYAERVARTTVKLAYWGGVDLSGPFTHLGVESIGALDID